MAKNKRTVVISDEAGMVARMTVTLTDEEIGSLPRRPADHSLRCLVENKHHFLAAGDGLWVEGDGVLCAWVRPYAVFRASIDDLLSSDFDVESGSRTVPCAFQNRPDLERLRAGVPRP